MHVIKIGDNEYQVEATNSDSTSGVINTKNYTLDVVGKDGAFHLIKDHKSYDVAVVEADFKSKRFILNVNGVEVELEAKDKYDLLLAELGMENLGAAAVNDLKAPMPGLVLKTEVAPGTTVKKGDALVVLEAMKMENILKAENDAVVKSVLAQIGKAVEKNEILIEFEI